MSEVIISESPKVACDGGEFGHPKVYLQASKEGTVCPYCSREYKLAANAKAAHH